MDHFESFFELIGILEKFEDSMVELYVYEQSGSYNQDFILVLTNSIWDCFQSVIESTMVYCWNIN